MAINKYLGKEKGLSQYYNEQNVKIQKAIKEINTNGIEPTVPEISNNHMLYFKYKKDYYFICILEKQKDIREDNSHCFGY